MDWEFFGEKGLTALRRFPRKTAMNYRETTNPAMREGAFRALSGSPALGAMTARGTFGRTAILLLLAIGAAVFSWTNPYVDPAAIGAKLAIFSLVGFGLALATIFRMDWSPYTAPAYAIAEGLVLGTISRLLNGVYPGIVAQAVALTFAVFAAMLLLYRFRIIQVTDRFRTIVVAATAAICAVYLLSLLLRLFGGTGMGFLQQATPFGIIFSLLVVAIAALNLVINFDFIERVSRYGAPKYMEWYAAFGLILTLLWLYVEVLNLLSKLRQDR
ncbi:MAG: Bax inhibitor-1/YccA family protein [Puniceicoccales bacterium]|nr:Bax inhibitor-1/YccA family protein [Puniceicoccales bacterium]